MSPAREASEHRAAVAALERMLVSSQRAWEALERDDGPAVLAALDERDAVQEIAAPLLARLAGEGPSPGVWLTAVREAALALHRWNGMLEARIAERRDQLADELQRLETGSGALAGYAGRSIPVAARFEAVG
ncbi:MAG: hypothetical protein JO040_13080 [Gemmatimonadetes bacterium]|nr:hypothetical protein [Gemmatimonadota bacterium]